MARARANGKPVVAMKVGGSAVDAAAAASHTASLAGSDAIYDAAFRQLGVERAVTPEDLIEIAYACTRGRLPSCVHNATGFLRIAYACTRGRLPRSRRLAVMMVSDGPGVLMADAAEREGVQLTPLPPEAQAEVLDWVPFAPPRNPLDLTAQPLNEPALIDKSFDLLLGQEGFPAIAAFSLLWASSPKTGEILFNSISAAAARYPDRYFALSVIARDEVRQRYEEAGIAIFEDPWRAVEAVAAAMRCAERLATPPAPSPPPLEGLPPQNRGRRGLARYAGCRSCGGLRAAGNSSRRAGPRGRGSRRFCCRQSCATGSRRSSACRTIRYSGRSSCSGSAASLSRSCAT